MTSEAPSRVQTGIALCLRLASGPCSIPLHRVHTLAGFARLSGEPDDYFLGWLTFHGEPVPVFDLNRIVCDQPTAENFGARIIVVEAEAGTPTQHLGLLAASVTDTISPRDPGWGNVEALDLDMYLPMLYSLIPPAPANA
jgi:chemotaxis signal transduction protein